MKKFYWLMFSLLLCCISCSKDNGPVEVAGISISPSGAVSLKIGETQQLRAAVTPENATDKTVKWTSSNTSIATVTNTGLVTAINIGDATITASSGAVSTTCSVKVSPIEVESIAIEQSEYIFTDEPTSQLTAVITPSDATNKNISWSSSNTNVVTVDENGLVTRVSIGKAVITATTEDGEKSASCAITALPAMIKCEKGTFIMGSPKDEKDRYLGEIQHQVTLSKDFYIGKYEVTAQEYCEFLNNAEGIIIVDAGNAVTNAMMLDENSNEVLLVNSHGYIDYSSTTGKWRPLSSTSIYPVTMVTWYGAKAFADWLGCSLPTEAQWEYACRAGTTTAYSFGDDASILGDYAWYTDNYTYTARPVGTKLPNPWGIYDIHGNANEWCLDWYKDYTTEAVTDPVNTEAAYGRVTRGGNTKSLATYCRSAYRGGFQPTYQNLNYGFRLVYNPQK